MLSTKKLETNLKRSGSFQTRHDLQIVTALTFGESPLFSCKQIFTENIRTIRKGWFKVDT